MAYTTINKPSLQFNTALYTGNGSTLTVTGVGFQPDFTWLKERSAAGNHKLADVVRGTTKYLSSNLTDAEDTTGSGIQSWNSDGFSLSNATDINDNGITYASWNWKANGAGVSNNSGSITSTVSANTTSGFSVVKWTGTGSGQSNVTIGHGLGAVPKMILFKQLDAGNWVVYHNSLGINNYLVLNSTAGSAAATGLCNPTSTNIVLPTSYGGTNSTAGELAYCFAEVKGFSKFGSYTGNGSTDGTFVYTGFKPAFIITKCSSNAGNEWEIYDNKRTTFNVATTTLEANSSSAELNFYSIDILSNGFKQRQTYNTQNASGFTYIYMAFAEQPLVGTNNVPATAR